jgi:hypothetical protein
VAWLSTLFKYQHQLTSYCEDEINHSIQSLYCLRVHFPKGRTQTSPKWLFPECSSRVVSIPISYAGNPISTLDKETGCIGWDCSLSQFIAENAEVVEIFYLSVMLCVYNLSLCLVITNASRRQVVNRLKIRWIRVRKSALHTDGNPQSAWLVSEGWITSLPLCFTTKKECMLDFFVVHSVYQRFEICTGDNAPDLGLLT